MPNVVDDFYVCDDIIAVDVQHEPVVVSKSECVVDFRCCVADQRPVVEVIVGLDPRTEGNLVQVLCRSIKLHVVVDARLLKVEHEVGCREKLASFAIEERRAFARELLKN